MEKTRARSRGPLTPKRLFAAGLALCAMAATPSRSEAHGASAGGAQLPESPQPVTEDGRKALEKLAAFEAERQAGGPIKDVGEAAKEAAETSRKALGRADGLERSKDHEGATLLSRIALIWADIAVYRGALPTVLERADAAEKKLSEVRERRASARALLAEAEAKRIRLEAALVDAAAALGRQTSPKEKSSAPANSKAPKPKPAEPKPPKPQGARP